MTESLKVKQTNQKEVISNEGLARNGVELTEFITKRGDLGKVSSIRRSLRREKIFGNMRELSK